MRIFTAARIYLEIFGTLLAAQGAAAAIPPIKCASALEIPFFEIGHHPRIETPRYVLGGGVRSEAELRPWIEDPAIMAAWVADNLWHPRLDVEIQAAIANGVYKMESPSARRLSLAIREKISETFVGLLQVTKFDEHERILLAYDVIDTHLGRGVAVEAVNYLTRAIEVNGGPGDYYAWVGENNLGSRKVLEKLGFEMKSRIADGGGFILGYTRSMAE